MNAPRFPRPEEIRNLGVIAHIDHGKTTLTNQLLSRSKNPGSRGELQKNSALNPIERDRGITIKLAPVTIQLKIQQELKKTFNFELFTLNLIDTPGHVDFSYEVSRSLAACEGAILLVDATQGIQAQTLAHSRTALDLGLTLIPVINKIDLPTAKISETQAQLSQVFGWKAGEMSLISAKTGEGVDDLIERVVHDIPPPRADADQPLRALVFNTVYDQHLGVIAFIRLFAGRMAKGERLFSLEGKMALEARDVGIFTPTRDALPQLQAGQVGYLTTGLKDIQALKVGETLTKLDHAHDPPPPLPGFKPPQPMVFADVFPAPPTTFAQLNSGIQKLQLTDAALVVKPTHSPSLGTGFHLGFLGVFHIEITRERLREEYQVESVFTQPTVRYLVDTTDGETLTVEHPTQLPGAQRVKEIREPLAEVSILAPPASIGGLMHILEEHRATQKTITYLGKNGDQSTVASAKVEMNYTIPLIELVTGFVDEMKSASQGFASLDYRLVNPQPVEAVKLDILVNHRPLDALSRLVPRADAEKRGRQLITQLKARLPREQFAYPIQAAVEGKIIARDTQPAFRKDVTAKLYGGDQTRKDKLLKKQKAGKSKLAKQGKVVVIPKEIFSRLLKT